MIGRHVVVKNVTAKSSPEIKGSERTWKVVRSQGVAGVCNLMFWRQREEILSVPPKKRRSPEANRGFFSALSERRKRREDREWRRQSPGGSAQEAWEHGEGSGVCKHPAYRESGKFCGFRFFLSSGGSSGGWVALMLSKRFCAPGPRKIPGRKADCRIIYRF